MKTKVLLTLTIAALLFAAVGWTVHGQKNKTPNTSYEYQVLADPTETGGLDDGLKKLNELGAQGWELVGVSRGPKAPSRLYLKRTTR